ncbi:hypothetical protein BDZ91DRAFT_363804 [Kalaharituber pfeilii]|nr:hypothetical protein BDZ91DRAFT_363804 [Kalaharituber pfeilii]
MATETAGDMFDPLLLLEEAYYEEGYNDGLRDGEKAGLVEGRLFGLEKGFDKFVELGRLQGRVSVWKARIPPESTENSQSHETRQSHCAITNPRIRKQIHQLENYVSSLSTANDEETVEEVAEALKRGKAKFKIITNMIGEKESVIAGSGDGSTAYEGEELDIEEGNFKKNVRR